MSGIQAYSSDVAFSPAVKAIQARKGSRDAYAGVEQHGGWRTEIDDDLTAFLAAQDTSAHFIGLNQNSYRTRLKALDDIAAATRVALYQAPQDPVLNQYYLNTLSARDATLGQLRQVTSASSTFRSY